MSSRSKLDPVTRYANRVVNGSEIAGPLVKLACQRHLRDLENRPKTGLVWDLDKARLALGFFPNVLRLSGGGYENTPFILQPAQEFIVGSLFGWMGPDGYRRFRVAFIEMGKGNGKSPLAAGIGVYMLAFDNEPRAEVYAAAVDRDQAQILFRDAIAMRNSSPLLSEILDKRGGNGHEWELSSLHSKSFFRPLASDHKGTGQSGPRPHCALLDEVHEHPTRAMVEFMRAGTKGRRQALIFMITNSGYDRTSVCWDYHKMGERVLTRVLDNDSFFFYICGLEPEKKVKAPDGSIKTIPGDDWRDEKVWRKANPLLGVSISYKYLRELVREAEGMPSKQSIVRRLNFCEWTEGSSFWLGQEVWDGVQANLKIEDYFGRTCHGGLDVSAKRDLTALSLVFTLDDGSKAVFVWLFMPADNIRQREDRDGVPYSLWRDEGFIEATPGPVVNLEFIAEKINSLAQVVDIQGIACDQYKKDAMQAELDEIDCRVELIDHPQGFRKNSGSELWMPKSVEVTEEHIVKGPSHIRIDSNPCLTWNASCVVMTEDAQGNKKPDKRKANGRIDGITAMIEAMGLAESGEKAPEYTIHFIGGGSRLPARR